MTPSGRWQVLIRKHCILLVGQMNRLKVRAVVTGDQLIWLGRQSLPMEHAQLFHSSLCVNRLACTVTAALVFALDK